MFTCNDSMILELLDKHHVDDFDDLLIEIKSHMIEQKELREQDTRTKKKNKKYLLG